MKNDKLRKRIRLESNIKIRDYKLGFITLSELIKELQEIEGKQELELMKEAIEIAEQRRKIASKEAESEE